MALVNVPVVVSASGSKQIVVTPGSSTSVIYTVPTGKTFTGNIIVYQTSYPQVNGVYVTTISSWSASLPSFIIPVTLLAGSTVSNGSSSYTSWTLVGVEA